MSSVISKQEYGELVSQHARRVLSFVMRLLADRNEAEDVAQDVFVKAYQKLDTFRGDSPFLSWLLRIAYHESIDHLRRRQPHMVDIDDITTTNDLMTCSALDMELTTGNEERIRLLQEAVEQLKPDEQLLIHMYYYEDRSLNDIAYITDVKPNTLSARLHRIRERLLIIIKEHEQNRR